MPAQSLGFPGGSVIKNLPANAGDAGSVPGSGYPLEEEMAPHSSILTWEIPGTEEPGRLPSLESQRVGHDLATKQQHTTFKTHAKKLSSKSELWDFPGGPVVTEPPCKAGAAGLLPGGRAETLRVMEEVSPCAASTMPMCSGAHMMHLESQYIAAKDPSWWN